MNGKEGCLSTGSSAMPADCFYEHQPSSASRNSLDGIGQPVDFVLRVVQGE
jgi:hypothetical protein